MSEPVSSWERMPPEILEKIFNLLPQHMLADISLVCTHWQTVIHGRAASYLTRCVKNELIDEKQLERWGWNTRMSEDNHSISTCSCIHLAFGFFTQKKSPSVLVKRCSRSIPGGASGETFVVRGQKVFVSTLKNGTFSIKVLDRLKPDKEPEMWILPESYGRPGASIATYKDFMAILLQRQQETNIFSERVLWVLVLDGRNETSFWLDNSQLAEFDITPDKFRPRIVTLGKNLLAVCGYTRDSEITFNYWLVLWKVNTSQTTSGSPPHVLGVLKVSSFLGPSDLLVNEKFFLILKKSLINKLSDIMVIEKTKLFAEDQNQVAENAKKIDPSLPGNPWRLLKVCSSLDEEDDEGIRAYLEPGNSSRLALYMFGGSDFNFIILDVMTGKVTCQFSLLNVFFPACWHGGNFLFCKALQPVPEEVSCAWYEDPPRYDGDIQEQCFGFTLFCI